MVRQTSKKNNGNGDKEEDILFMLSCIRSRQNALIFFLELFSITTAQKLSQEQYAVYKQEFLQKQKINTQSIKSTLEKFSSNPPPLNQTKSFWIKLKAVIRVSLERAKSLGMTTQSLHNYYEQVVKLVEDFYNAGSPIKEYLQIQQLLKRRTIETLMATKHGLTDHSSQDFGKIRSETFLKGSLKSENSSFSPTRNPEKPLTSIQDMVTIKEATRIRRKEKVKAKPMDIKKVNSGLCRMEPNLAEVMEGKLDCQLDKKKPQSQNMILLYDALFLRNIGNHKMISKYVHSCERLQQKVAQMRRIQSQRKNTIDSKKGKRGPEQALTMDINKRSESNNRLGRPKTSKHPKKTIVFKNSQSRNQKIYDLLKAI